jgi:uncharacterized protein (DUF2147 family)
MNGLITIVAGLVLSAGLANAAGKTEAGTTAAIGPCGGGYCITLKTGKHAGERIGTFNGKDGHYSGKITDPDAKKTYDGVMTVSGNTVTMKGCVMSVFCQSQTWTRL